MAHGIFRGDNVTSITDPAKIRTIQVYADIDNGAPITLGALAASGKYAGEAEVFTTATANGVSITSSGKTPGSGRKAKLLETVIQ